MDARLLRTFMTVARLGSFSAAARELGYTQSAVSQHILALESDLGANLLTRRPVTPTEAGKRLLEHAGPILLRLDAARAEVARVAARPDVRLRLAVTPLAVTPGLFHAVAAVAQDAGIELTVLAQSAADVARNVAVGDVDLGLVAGIAVRSDPLRLPGISSLRARLVSEHDLMVAVRADHPLAGCRAVALASLADALWLDAPHLIGAAQDLGVMMGAPAVRISARYLGLDVRALLELLASAQGVALLPRSVLDASPVLTGVRVCEPDLVHRVEVVHMRTAPTPVRALVDTVTGFTG